MAEKEQESAYPLPQTNGYTRHDTEAMDANDARKQQRKKKRIKCCIYIVVFAIFQFAVIAIFATTIMKVRTPQFRIHSASFNNFNAGTQANPSFNATMNTQFSLRNNNFGRYRYQNTTVQFSYVGTPVGQVVLRNSRVGWRTQRRFLVPVELNFANVSPTTQLATDLSNGILPITSYAASMRGRIDMIFVMGRNRATSMNCTMNIDISTQTLSDIVCRRR